MEFRDIQFGLPDAESEIQKYPKLVAQGFFDAFDVTGKILDDIQYVILGRKGAGKSLVAKHFIQPVPAGARYLATQKYLKDFPFRVFTELTTGDLDRYSKIQPAWQWVLSIALLTQVRQDHAGSFHTRPDFYEALNVLEKVGIVENSELKDIVLTSRKREIRIEIAKALGISYSSAEGDAITPLSLAQRLQSLLLNFRSPNQHILFVDGLDDVLTHRDIQFETLSGLIEAAGAMNEAARAAGCPVKIVILCRTDLFERVPNPNKNKIRQSRGLELDWFGDTPAVQDSPLFQMLNLRATLSGFSGDIFSQFLPEKINGRPIREHLLNATRHTPRDLIALMLELQKAYHGKKLGPADITSALKNYSKKFLVPELKDELSGYFPESVIAKIFGVLTGLHRKKFSYADVSREGGHDSSVPWDKALEHLFDCGALGQVYPKADGTDEFVFKFRNADASAVMNKQFVLMRGLEPAFGV